MIYQQNGLEIAVIGLAGKFPGSKTVDDFWRNLQQGVELISPFDDTPSENPSVGAVLADVDQFDAAFFGFNPAEAAAMDPQHRLFLECAWEALENAGYRSDTEERPIGVFAGVGMGTYLLYNLSPNPGLIESRGFLPTLVGVDKDYLPTRVSYKLNLTGPSLSVGTACSSSLVAVHLACQSLLSGDCDMAIAAGVAVKVPQNALTLSPDEIISPDGHCRAFDCNAKGTIGGNGIGVVVLKRLEDAIADRDYIYAVVKGSAINNDGAMKVGYTAPSQEGQSKVIRAAQMMAEVDPETITYLETHGTGTPLGDPIEVAAMTQAFRTTTSRNQFCAIGSVKTNVGHLDAAAGITGFIKTVLALHYKQIPPSLNFETPNPQIDFENSPFYVNTQLKAWKTDGSRRAGVSSFGFGGTNVHVVLEEAPADFLKPSEAPETRPYQLLVLSTKTASALEKAAVNVCDRLKQAPDLNLADVAYTLGVGRWALNHRCFVVAHTLEDGLKSLESGNLLTGTAQESSPPVIFLFPGQGSQYVNMGKELYTNEPIFREECDRCFTLLQSKHGIDLYSILFPDGIEDSSTLTQTQIAQPALFVIEYALAKLWISWGVQPQAMIGHSSGEYVAATLAGVFSLEDALSLVVLRGKLMQQQPPGAMLAVNLSVKELEPFLNETLSLAASNSPYLNVVSGTIEAVEKLAHQLEEQGITAHSLHTSHAFHSSMMEGAIAPFVEQLRGMTLKPPQIPFISNVTGTWITTEAATAPFYWAQHLRQTVQFSQGIAELLKNKAAIFLEVGPGRTLSTLTRQQASDRLILTSLPHPKRDGEDKGANTSLSNSTRNKFYSTANRFQLSDEECLLTALGQLWINGVDIDWSSFYAQQSYPCHRIPLPTYPFEHQRYWIDPPKKAEEAEEQRSRGAEEQQEQRSNRSRGAEEQRSRGAEEQQEQRSRGDKKPNSSLKNASQSDTPNKKADIGEWFYIPSWKRSVLPKMAETTQKRCWVIFGDYLGLAAAIIQRLQQQGHRVIEVKAGKIYQKNQDVFTINPSDRAHYEALIQEVLSFDQAPIIAHLWTLSANLSLEEYQTVGLYSLLYLAQAIAQQNTRDLIHIGIVSSNLQDVTGTEKIYPEKATLLGACRVIPQEYPNLTCSALDLVLPTLGVSVNELLVNQIITEMMTQAENFSAPIIAYRGNYRWLPTDEPLYLKPVAGETPLRHQGVYLITGGLGGIGLTIAEYLAKTVQAKLALISRSTFSPRQEWGQYATEDNTALKIQKIQELEAMGAEVLILKADVADLEQMQAVKERIEQSFGQVKGIFHTAGVPGDGIIQLKTPEQVARVLRPKVQGTLVLQKIYPDPLDFWVLFSSLSSHLGGIGQVDYCAANCFLDAFARSQASNPNQPIVSINWDIWQEIGMGVNISGLPESLKQERLEALKTGITSSEGLDSIHRILQSGYHQVIVSPKDWQTVQKKQPLSRIIVQEDINPTPASHGRSLSTPYIAPRNEIEQGIAELWQEQLGIAQVGVNDNFFELGGHSLLAVRVVSRLRELYTVDLSLRSLLFESPTVAQLANAIAQKLSPQDDSEEMYRLLTEIEQLSENEVKNLLTQ